jgi:hypothetical protein
MRNFFEAVVRFLLGPGSSITLTIVVCLAYYLAKN